MGRAAPGVPLIYFPHDGSIVGAIEGNSSLRRHATAMRALDVLEERLARADHRSAEIHRALDAAIEVTHALAEGLASAVAPPEVAPGAEVLPVHDCFGVRLGALSAPQNAAQTAGVVARGVAAMADVLVDTNDLLTETRALWRLLGAMHGEARAPASERPGAIRSEARSAAALAAPEPAVYERTSAPRPDGIDRWVVTHHTYFAFNLHAAAWMRDAAAAARGGEEGRAVASLGEASIFVRGFTGAMMHSGAISPAYYAEVVRPTMCPPAVPVLLTGLMQPEHAAFRAAVADFLDACPESFTELAASSEALAHARDELLDADLVDIERHTSLAHALVGSERSLVQRQTAQANAVSALRSMRHARAARYAPFMCFGDRAIVARTSRRPAAMTSAAP
jgi:hypothetical protein